MEITGTAIPEIKILRPRRFVDDRGYFSESYNATTMAEAGLSWNVAQVNRSFSAAAGTLRGLHFQSPPHGQHKLISVIRGKILDVAVDIRHGSATYGQYVAAALSAERGDQMSIPIGFAHGFCTLETNTEILYLTSDFYSSAHDGGIIWDDPDIGIEWPFSAADITLSDRDQCLPRLSGLTPVFGMEHN